MLKSAVLTQSSNLKSKYKQKEKKVPNDTMLSLINVNQWIAFISFLPQHTVCIIYVEDTTTDHQSAVFSRRDTHSCKQLDSNFTAVLVSDI